MDKGLRKVLLIILSVVLDDQSFFTKQDIAGVISINEIPELADVCLDEFGIIVKI